jgi:hypothetical protein
MDDWRRLTNALNRTMVEYAPGWTDHHQSDPGVTILQLMAFLSETALYEIGLVEDGTAAASRIRDALDDYDESEPVVVRVNGERWRRIDALTDAPPHAPVYAVDHTTGTIVFGDGIHGRVPEQGSTISARYRIGGGEKGRESIAVWTTWPLPGASYRMSLRDTGTMQLEVGAMLHEEWSGPQRLRFFAGRVLTATDLGDEQEYHLANHRRHLQSLHGRGVVSGLDVAATPGGELTIQPGSAIDALGREIHLKAEAALTPPVDSPSAGWIAVEYAERLVDPVPSTLDGITEASRIEEGCVVLFVTAPCENGVTVARVVREHGGWRVDPSFVPATVP